MRLHRIFLRPGAVLVLLLLAIAGAAWRAPHRLYYDHAVQLAAAPDYLSGLTASPNLDRSADPLDLARDRPRWIIGFPPGYTFAVLGIRRITGDLARAHRLLAFLCVALGALGWRRVLAGWPELPPGWQAAGLALITISPPGAISIAELHPEAFIFAITPWQIWLIREALEPGLTRSRSFGLLAGLGLLSGAAYTFRYAAALTSLAFLACAALALIRRPGGQLRPEAASRWT